MTQQLVLIIGGLFGALAIVLGAFGAHALKKRFTPDLMQSFETGVKYQMYHALVLLILGFNLNLDTSLERTIAWFLIIGTVLFSFSIYGLCISASLGKKIKLLGPITPLGGLCLLIGWILVVARFL
ncbi:DUF423 domain-containing protein [Ascidiimonas sp. W6]|uniref:DUF423 domain-containing protein n=1 Tax=Ascidiimonas meishanensis TaxID=3128903 RepID=UPI0030ED21FE